jgi:hypothetical protein
VSGFKGQHREDERGENKGKGGGGEGMIRGGGLIGGKEEETKSRLESVIF